MKQKTISIIIIVAVYLIGLVSGIFLSGSAMCRLRCRAPGPKHRVEGRMMKRLCSRLDLSEKQQAEVKTILESNRPKMEELRKKQRAEMNEIRNNLNTSLKGTLTPQQALAFDKMCKCKWNPEKRMGIRRQGMRLDK